MKLGILCENYYPTLGGEQEHILNLRRHLEQPTDGSEPVDVRIIVPHVKYDVWHGPADDPNVLRPATSWRIHGAGSASQITLTPRAYPALKAIFDRERFDLLHIHAPLDIGLPGWALFAFDGPVVGTIHSYFPHHVLRTLAAPWYRYVMRRMTRVIAVSETARDTIRRYADFECTVIGNGVDCEAFGGGRPMAPFADGLTNILSVGRLEHRNGPDLVIDAFGLVASGRRDLRLLLAGDGPMRAECEARVRQLPPHVAERVVFLGAVWEHRADLYASAHCFALGARRMSFSILLLEALAAGLPVAALPGQGIDRAGDHWSLAHIAAAETAESYAAALERALAPVEADYAARARAMAGRYDWSQIVPKIRTVYEEAVTGGPVARAETADLQRPAENATMGV
jgi:glycosyltransferase involved in cell wall biosynthesis